MATNEFWVILPFNNKETAKNALQEQLYDGLIVEKPAGSWKIENNFRVRSE